ncbi:helix-turn-helix domain-containing protein [Streptomyces erythrochromogenes]|uniref:helix-turn-helix domain-containing protein n=1 Tax=Streptomyces erythrochromogenes TaxID=285574 RepID=UPI0038652B41|nr:helix-turn-helix domain-containing protein [Streptomyces erythrochromogenes]
MTGGADGAAAWQVRADLRPGVLALTGHLGAAGTHAHAAVQVLVCTRGAVLLGDGYRRAAVRAAVIPAGARHCVTPDPGEPDPPQGWSLYVDTDGAAGQALHRRAAERDAPPGAAVTRWAAAAAGLLTGPDGMPPADVLAVAERFGPPAEPRHPALSAALARLPDALAAGGPVRITELAARTGVSAGRLGHLFGEQLGLPFPAWVRWARLRAAMDAARGGANLTEAAHAAGFADGAHLTRTFRAMFGITPSRALGGTHWQNR